MRRGAPVARTSLWRSSPQWWPPALRRSCATRWEPRPPAKARSTWCLSSPRGSARPVSSSRATCSTCARRQPTRERARPSCAAARSRPSSSRRGAEGRRCAEADRRGYRARARRRLLGLGRRPRQHPRPPFRALWRARRPAPAGELAARRRGRHHAAPRMKLFSGFGWRHVWIALGFSLVVELAHLTYAFIGKEELRAASVVAWCVLYFLLALVGLLCAVAADNWLGESAGTGKRLLLAMV